ncbi:MAG: farnesyltranstransferase [Azospirillum brasilense]|nr:MAG: farnesyltranstransferase [Azospirillum brasilense]
MQTARSTHSAATPLADLNALRQLVAADLERVNRVIVEQSKSQVALVSDVAAHIIAAGGKRLRPCLTLASAMLCGYEGERHVRLAACVEFIHTATLLHDDVVDESTLRRGEQTANDIWGNQSSVLVGDFLFSRAFQLMVADGSLDVLKILSDASATISEGEVQQLMVSHDLAITQEIYEQVIGAKTAALFAAASEIGPVVAGKPELRDALQAYGYALGMAFQMADDALDYAASSEAELGKAIGDDFREGKITMPVMVAYQRATPEEKTFWEHTLEHGETLDAATLAHAKTLMQKHGAIEATMQRATHFRDVALNALAGFADSPAKDALAQAAAFAVTRRF